MNRLCEIWDDSVGSPLPRRSRYFSPQPIGLGTGMVESLTSYITRVARAHDLPPWVLVTRDVAMGFKTAKATLSRGLCDLFASAAPTLNGNCSTAEDGAQTMESLTLRNGLKELTLADLKGIVSHAAMLHPFEHWCPLCFEEWRKQKLEIYLPLLWQVRAVTICPRHRCALVELCPRCSRRHRPLSRHGAPGRCPWCGHWLGLDYSADSASRNGRVSTEFSFFMTSEVLHLLTHRKRIFSAGDRSFSTNMQFLFERHGGSLASFARGVGHHAKSVWYWMESRQKPRLYGLALIAYRYRLRVLDLLGSRLSGEIGKEPCLISTALVEGLKPRLNKHDPEQLRRALEAAAVSSQSPPPSVCSVARELRCHSSYLQRKFPELTAKVSGQYRQYWSIHKEQRLRFARAITESKTSEIAAKGEYPSQRKVIRALPTGIHFRMPEVKQAWLQTLREWEFEPSKGASTSKAR